MVSPWVRREVVAVLMHERGYVVTKVCVRIPRDGERGFYGNVNGDSRAW